MLHRLRSETIKSNVYYSIVNPNKDSIGNFKNLPDEIILEIIKYLNVPNLGQLELCSKYFWVIINYSKFNNINLFTEEKIKYCFKKNLEFAHLFEIIRRPTVDLENCVNEAFEWAAGNGHADIVKFLVNDPRINRAVELEAHRKAVIMGHYEVIPILLEKLINNRNVPPTPMIPRIIQDHTFCMKKKLISLWELDREEQLNWISLTSNNSV